MTDEEFRRIYLFLKNKYGIDMSRKKEIISGRLDNYIRENGWDNYLAYMNAVEADATGQLESKLVDLLTTNHTFFMREFDHFRFLRREVLPYLQKKEADKKDLAIWCAAASTGQEAYMLAMMMEDYFGLEHRKWDTQILATDVSMEVLEQAVRGIYSKEQISELPEHWKRRFLKALPDGESYAVTEQLKQQVLFRQFNLMEPFPFRRKMHIVFLRNVMIYFDDKTKRQLIQKVYDVMEDGGYLFIGKTETLDRNATPFQMIEPSIFRKRER